MTQKKRILLTGCAGFIGTNFVKKIACQEEVKRDYSFLILDALTYAGNYFSIEKEICENNHLSFIKLDIRDQAGLIDLSEKESLDGIIHFAAESHVDRSIKNPSLFLETNVFGTYYLLQMALEQTKKNKDFRYLQISTDEVYGSLEDTSPPFNEESPLKANSPYSVSKASGDLLVRSYVHTFGLNAIITRCSNNYGPYQYPEKFIPCMISKALRDLPLPIYGNGGNIRDWIHVDDHNRGVWKAFTQGKSGEIYNFGASKEYRNLDLAKLILAELKKPLDLIEFVEDRLGHDHRYGIDSSKAQNELGWYPEVEFEKGLEETIAWYQENQVWIEQLNKR